MGEGRDGRRGGDSYPGGGNDVFPTQPLASGAEAGGGGMVPSLSSNSGGGGGGGGGGDRPTPFERIKKKIQKFGSFVGPGFMIAVAYIDPGNYATDIAAGASYRFKLLFVVLLANLFAILPAKPCNQARDQIAIIATDVAEVIGFAIGLNLLIPQVPLVAGCAISIADVMAILFFYRPDGSTKGLRAFELFVALLVLGVAVCFCIQLSLIGDATAAGQVFEGYLPSGAVVERTGLYQACGILGATVIMPHSLSLGSGIVQPRLREYDERKGLLPPEPLPSSSSSSASAAAASSASSGMEENKGYYVPSLAAINHSLRVSVAELAVSLLTLALFVSSAILVVAGASPYDNETAKDGADIFAIHDLLVGSISPPPPPRRAAFFALALLPSGASAGIVCTIAGQMICEGHT
ncbi:manganese transporter [Zalerion maritima]|uniref:Manganese transporter n=1 Tax=Zalerion maritima TaxID=339359 RepID=A0AAD5RMD5_9PEZI|nr:manganese transporter [Zalerion maritima]